VGVTYQFKIGEDESGNNEYLLDKDGNVVSVTPSPVSKSVNFIAYELDKLQFNLDGTWYDAPSTFKCIEMNSGATFRAKLNPDVEAPADAYLWLVNYSVGGNGATKDCTFGGPGMVEVSVGDKTITSFIEVGPENKTITITWEHKKETPNVIFDSDFKAYRFTIDYSVYGNINKNTWAIRVDKVASRTKTIIAQLGWRDNPVDEAEAQEAISDMTTLCARGTVRRHGSGGDRYYWHTIAATEAHENVHLLEWTKTSGHYLPQVESKLEQQIVKYVDYLNNPDGAKNALVAQRDAINDKFSNACVIYCDSLDDNEPHCRPVYAAQEALLPTISRIRAFAAMSRWTSVDQTTTPCSHTYKTTDKPEYPCYIPYPDVDFSP
jgi:hypothetical protein